MDFTVPFQAVFGTLAHLFDVGEAAQPRLLARVRNMQRDGFPPGINVGRGVKVAYGIEEISAVLFYHVMVDAGFPPDFAIRGFHAHRELLLSTAVDVRAFENPSSWPGPASRLLVVRGSLISPDEAPSGAERPFPGSIEARQLIEVQAELMDDLGRPAGVHLIDIAGSLSKALHYLVRGGFGSEADVLEGLRDLGRRYPVLP